MVKLTFKSIKIFLACMDIIEKITELDNEPLEFNCKPEGIAINVMDPSHVSMIDFFIPNTYFEKYACKKAIVLGVNIKGLTKILKRAEKKDKISIALDPKENKLNFELEGIGKSHFSLKLTDMEPGELPQPKMTPGVSVIFQVPNLFERGLSHSELFSDHVDIHVTSKQFIMSSQGDNGKAKLILPKNTEGITWECKQTITSKFPLSYLSKIAKIIPITESLLMELSNDLPINLIFKLKDEQEIYFKYWLAPRVEEEEPEEELDEEVKETLEEMEGELVEEEKVDEH